MKASRRPRRSRKDTGEAAPTHCRPRAAARAAARIGSPASPRAEALVDRTGAEHLLALAVLGPAKRGVHLRQMRARLTRAQRGGAFQRVERFLVRPARFSTTPRLR
jgi:hypothetical protein